MGEELYQSQYNLHFRIIRFLDYAMITFQACPHGGTNAVYTLIFPILGIETGAGMDSEA